MQAAAVTVRWGVAGTGSIAETFAGALRTIDGAQLAAVSSRTQERASSFALQVGADRAYGSLEAMLDDAAVDAVYVASPHSEHSQQTIAALEAGKHVLVEKPIAVEPAQAQAMIAAAERTNRFLMEALWSRFLPSYRRIQQLVQAGEIGEISSITASFGFPAPPDPAGRLLNPALGGGALLDIGIYPVHLASWLLGRPDSVAATASIGSTGVDVDVAVSMGWSGRAVATAQASFTTWLPMTGLIAGSEGWIELPLPHHHPDSFTVQRHDGSRSDPQRRVEQWPVGEHGLRYEIEHVHECLAGGMLQSPVMPLSDSYELLETLTRARRAFLVAAAQR